MYYVWVICYACVLYELCVICFVLSVLCYVLCYVLCVRVLGGGVGWISGGVGVGWVGGRAGVFGGVVPDGWGWGVWCG